MTSRCSQAVQEYCSRRKQCLNPQGAPPGLFVLSEWITAEEEKEICVFLGQGKWAEHMSSKRPTQHFGYKYERSGQINMHKKMAGDWGLFESYRERFEREFPGVRIGQCLANFYFNDTGIGAHIDNECDLVFGLSVAGDINMIWSKKENLNGVTMKVKYEALIPARSLYIMSDSAALEWTHEIPNRKFVYYPEPNPQSPEYGNLKHKLRKEEDYGRASITFRMMMNEIE